MDQPRNNKALTREAERLLAERLKQGSSEALHALVLSHQGLVAMMARRYARLGISHEDLISEGTLGLLDAARRFEPSRGTRFTTYARWWVRAYMLAFVSSDRRMVVASGSRLMRRLRVQLRRAERELEQQKGGQVESAELAERLGVRTEDIAEARSALYGSDVPVLRDGHEGWGYEPVATEKDPEERVMEAEQRLGAEALTQRALEALDDREQRVVRERMLRDDARTLRELGRDLGISRERVRQIEARALGKMQRALQVWAS